jgi:hypothetical protein
MMKSTIHKNCPLRHSSNYQPTDELIPALEEFSSNVWKMEDKPLRPNQKQIVGIVLKDKSCEHTLLVIERTGGGWGEDSFHVVDSSI